MICVSLSVIVFVVMLYCGSWFKRNEHEKVLPKMLSSEIASVQRIYLLIKCTFGRLEWSHYVHVNDLEAYIQCGYVANLCSCMFVDLCILAFDTPFCSSTNVIVNKLLLELVFNQFNAASNSYLCFPIESVFSWSL